MRVADTDLWDRLVRALRWLARRRPDPLLALRGSGRELWADEPADRYIERLRSGW